MLFVQSDLPVNVKKAHKELRHSATAERWISRKGHKAI